MSGWQVLVTDLLAWLRRYGVYVGCCASAGLLTAWYATLPEPGFNSRGALPQWVPTELVLYLIGLSVPAMTAAFTAVFQRIAAWDMRIAQAILKAADEAIHKVDTRPAPTPDPVVPSPQPAPEPPGPVFPFPPPGTN
jgi:hypothetical protein